MKPLGAAYTPTADVEGEFNTFAKATGAPITLAGTPSLRLVRTRAGAQARITGNGITLSVDHNDGGGAVTGYHNYVIDLDDANIAAQAGDEYSVRINAGTADGESLVGAEVGHFYVQADGLTAQQKSDVNTEADTALTDYDAPTKAELDVLGTAALATAASLTDLFGTIVQSSVNDASATATGFTTTANVGSKVLKGYLRLTSGDLTDETCFVSWTGTTVAVLSDSSMPTVLKQFSAAPANSVTFDFRPL